VLTERGRKPGTANIVTSLPPHIEVEALQVWHMPQEADESMIVHTAFEGVVLLPVANVVGVVAARAGVEELVVDDGYA
jgi:hypothetical protein